MVVGFDSSGSVLHDVDMILVTVLVEVVTNVVDCIVVDEHEKVVSWGPVHKAT